MTTPKELELLMERAKADGAEDPAFFEALLEATIYVHVPKDKRQFPWRFMQFRHPIEGITVVPFFTNKARARRATQGMAHVEALNGRAFMEATRGFTLILNPQETPCCILYPEEVVSLLDEGYLAEVQSVEIDDLPSSIVALDSPPEGLVEILIPVLQDLPFVEVAYIAGRSSNKPEDPAATLIVLGGDPKLAERAARALTTVLQRQSSRFVAALDVLHFDTSKPPPEWIAGLALQPVFRRSTSAVRDPPSKASRN